MQTSNLWLLLFAVGLYQTPAAQPEAASASASAGVSAAGNSFAPQFSWDGLYLIFSSQAKNLTTNSDLSQHLNIFRKDLAAGSVDLISVNPDGTKGSVGNSAFYSVSSNGQLVAFASAAANLIENDTNSAADIFVRDLLTGTTVLVSADMSGRALPDRDFTLSRPLSSNPQISADGRLVVFESRATNLVSLASTVPSRTLEVFARDLSSNTTVLVSINTNGAPASDSYLPHVNADGRFVTFVSQSQALVAEGTPPGENLFIRDLQLETTTWVTRNLATYLGFSSNDYRLVDHSINDDGHVLAYKVSDRRAMAVWVFRYDVTMDSTLLVSTNSYYNSTPQLSGDGRFLAYEDGTNVLVWDNLLQTNILINVDLSGSHPATGRSHTPALSADGHSVAFLSDAGDLVTNVANGKFQVFWRDLNAGVARLVSRNSAGAAASANHELIVPAISGDGLRVAFESTAPDLVAGDLNQASDVFLFNAEEDSLSLVSRAHATRPAITGPGGGGITHNATTADGRVIAWFGYDSNIIPVDTNEWTDIFIRDLNAGTNRMISFGTNSLFDAEISADGRFVSLTQRTPPYSSQYADAIFRYDLLGGSNQMAMPTGVFSHAMSSDGSFVVLQLYRELDVYDFSRNSNSVVPLPQGFMLVNRKPVLSPDDQKLFFFGDSQLYVTFLPQNAPPRFVSHAPNGTDPINAFLRSVAISGDSQVAVFGIVSNSVNDVALFKYQIASDSVSFICSPCQNGSLNNTGALLAYENRRSDGTRSVHVRDLETGQTNLLSSAADLGLPSDTLLDSWNPLISGDGRFVLFLSRVASSVTNITRLYVRDRAMNQTLLLTPNPEGIGLITGTGAHLNIARDGRTATFQSFAGDLVAGDYNDKRDVFVVRLGSGDSDGDGMDDDWEVAYFGDLSRDGSGDFDGDGQTDLQEFRAGTHPTNKDSVLRAITVTRVGGGTRIFWSAITGRSYRVEFKEKLDDAGWTTVFGQVQVTGTTGWIDDSTTSSASQRFYRVIAIR